MRSLLNARHWSHHALCGMLTALMLAGPRVAAAQQPAQPGPLPKSPGAVAPEKPNIALVADPALKAAEELNLEGKTPADIDETPRPGEAGALNPSPKARGKRL